MGGTEVGLVSTYTNIEVGVDWVASRIHLLVIHIGSLYENFLNYNILYNYVTNWIFLNLRNNYKHNLYIFDSIVTDWF